MITCLEFIEIAERECFEAKDLLDWDDERKDALTKHYFNSLDADARTDVLCEIMEGVDPYADDFDLKHELYMYFEPRMRELVDDAFMLGDRFNERDAFMRGE